MHLNIKHHLRFILLLLHFHNIFCFISLIIFINFSSSVSNFFGRRQYLTLPTCEKIKISIYGWHHARGFPNKYPLKWSEKMGSYARRKSYTMQYSWRNWNEYNHKISRIFRHTMVHSIVFFIIRTLEVVQPPRVRAVTSRIIAIETNNNNSTDIEPILPLKTRWPNKRQNFRISLIE